MKRLFLFSVLVILLAAACTSQTAGPETIDADVKAADVTVFRAPT